MWSAEWALDAQAQLVCQAHLDFWRNVLFPIGVCEVTDLAMARIFWRSLFDCQTDCAKCPCPQDRIVVFLARCPLAASSRDLYFALKGDKPVMLLSLGLNACGDGRGSTVGSYHSEFAGIRRYSNSLSSIVSDPPAERMSFDVHAPHT